MWQAEHNQNGWKCTSGDPENLNSTLQNTHRRETISVQSMLQGLFNQGELDMDLRTHLGETIPM